MSESGRLAAIIVAAIFIFAGTGLIIYSGKRWWFFWRSGRWPRAKGIVTRSEVREDPNTDGIDFYPQVEYSFEVGDREFVAQALLIGFRNEPFYTRAQAQERANMFPVGATVCVWYHPNRPSECMLERKIQSGMLGVFIGGLLFSTVGSWLFFEAAFRR